MMNQDSQKTISLNRSCFPLCSHIKRLTKIQINNIFQNPCQFVCSYHNLNTNNITICLHCNLSFCGIQSKQKCIVNHQIISNQHIFSLSLNQSAEIYCHLCKQSINVMIKLHETKQQQQKISDDLKRLKKFMDFINQAFNKVSKIYKQSLKTQIILQNCNYRGLQNLGNTCFLNCDLQILNYSSSFVQLYSGYKIVGGYSKSILSSEKSLKKQIQFFYEQIIQQNQSKIWHLVSSKKQKKNEHNQKFIKSITNCKLNQLMLNFLNQMQSNQNNQNQNQEPNSAIQILQYIANIDTKYAFKQEQDAQQTLLFILDILIQGQFISMSYEHERYRKVEQFIGRQKITPLQRIFGTYLLSQIFCENCKKISYTFDLTYHLSIDLNTQKILNIQSIIQHYPSSSQLNRQKLYYKDLSYPQNKSQKNQINLPEFLHSFFATERLTKRQNFYSCFDCKSLVGYKKFYLVDTPQILIISIKRFNHKMIKNNKHIPFQQKIDLNDVCLIQTNQEPEKQKYELYGLIVHIGQTINSGHYVCYVKTNQSIWIRCSDSLIQKVKFVDVKRQQAYILFYKKIK